MGPERTLVESPVERSRRETRRNRKKKTVVRETGGDLILTMYRSSGIKEFCKGTFDNVRCCGEKERVEGPDQNTGVDYARGAE